MLCDALYHNGISHPLSNLCTSEGNVKLREEGGLYCLSPPRLLEQERLGFVELLEESRLFFFGRPRIIAWRLLPAPRYEDRVAFELVTLGDVSDILP